MRGVDDSHASADEEYSAHPEEQGTIFPERPLNERQAQIVAVVKERGYATIEYLARAFDVSGQTIRREIIRLDQSGLVKRFHGGAGVSDHSERLPYSQKRLLSTDGKQRIAQHIAKIIPDGATIFLDVGTTVEMVAHELASRSNLRIFTNSLSSAFVFAGRIGLEVFVLGGLLHGPDGSLVGDRALQALKDFKVDYAIIACSGFDGDGAAMDFDMQKVAIKRMAMTCSRQSILVADSSKFDRSAVVRIADPASFEILVTDGAPPAILKTQLQEAGVKVVVVA